MRAKEISETGSTLNIVVQKIDETVILEDGDGIFVWILNVLKYFTI